MIDSLTYLFMRRKTNAAKSEKATFKGKPTHRLLVYPLYLGQVATEYSSPSVYNILCCMQRLLDGSEELWLYVCGCRDASPELMCWPLYPSVMVSFSNYSKYVDKTH
jgi:hypothetical protein